MHIDCELPVLATAPSTAPVANASDVALIQSISRGDQRAMKVLFARHNVKTYRFIVRLVRDTSLAEDLVSEVFLDVWCQADKFQGLSQVSTWLLAIARHKALEALRCRSYEALDNDVAELLIDPADGPELTIQKKQRTALLLPCLMQLSKAHREVIDLVYYHGQSIDDVAQILGISRNTVKTRMFCARGRLEKLLADVGIHGVSPH